MRHSTSDTSSLRGFLWNSLRIDVLHCRASVNELMKCALVVGVVLLLTGCDTSERISRLEKQTQQLQAQVRKDQAATDYDLAAKCSRDAKAWFKENYSADTKTVTLDYTNHYNKSLNKCFVAVEHHYFLWGNFVDGAWVTSIMLWDIYENSRYGNFAQHHLISKSQTFSDSVLTCELSDKKCTTVEQFNELVRPYLSN